MAAVGVGAGDLVEVYNDDGATQAMAYPTPTAKKGETFMLFAAPTGTQGNVINNGTNELVLPNYKQTWANIRKLADAPATVSHRISPSSRRSTVSGKGYGYPAQFWSTSGAWLPDDGS